jgi:uncharacterized protein (TIGR00269 family)
VERTFLRTISEGDMIRRGDKVAVGLSGGKDSSTLLYLLNKHKEKFGIELCAVLVDEGIEGYRSITKEAAEKLCRQLGVELKVLSYRQEFGTKLDDVPQRLGREIQWCSWCGVFRRSALNKAARAAGATKLAVGHNLDDEAQSVVMNFFRGDANQLQRLGSAEETEGLVNRIKPLKNVPEKETTLFAVLQELPFSDAECPHSHDMMRRKVGAFLNQMELDHPGSKMQVAKFHARLKAMLPESKKELRTCSCGEPTSRERCKKCELLSELSSARP